MRTLRTISKAEFDRIPADYKGIYEDYQGQHPAWKGRRTAMLPGEGATLSVEGIHFLVDGDYRYLPELHKSNAEEWGCYQHEGRFVRVQRIFRISDSLQRLLNIDHLDWASTTTGEDIMLPGGDAVKVD